MRLIDADALIAQIEKRLCHAKTIVWLCRIIGEVPTIEADPVRHGAWIDPEDNDGHTEWHCSYCGDVVCTICGYPGAKYCSVCGTKMEVKNEDGID